MYHTQQSYIEFYNFIIFLELFPLFIYFFCRKSELKLMVCIQAIFQGSQHPIVFYQGIFEGKKGSFVILNGQFSFSFHHPTLI